MNGNSMHMVAALWASDIADHVLPTFESIVPEDARPRMAVQAARDRAQGKILMKDARKAAFAAHRAARQAHELHFGKTAQAARAAGHAAATAHVIGHAAHSANYAIKAASDPTSELQWQQQILPGSLPLLFCAQLSKWAMT